MYLKNFIQKKITGRFKLFLAIWILELLLFFLLRNVLAIYSYDQFSWSPKHLAQIYGLGLFYDIGFLFYFNAPIALTLFCLPEKFYTKPWLFIFFIALLSLLLSILLFSCLAEYFFWDEFSVRFNFVAVDYLVYGTEVINNIKESYPYKTIISGMLLISVALISIQYRTSHRLFQQRHTLRTKTSFLLSYAICILAVILFINQAPRNNLTNNYLKELGSNGPYQFFTAFKDNKIEYRRFYRLGDDHELSQILKEITQTTQNAGLYDISQPISFNQPEEKFNVVIISIESFNADFMSRFGNKANITPHLDRLLSESLLFTNLYATGTRTVRGLEAISLAIPPTPGQSIVRRPDNHGFASMGSVFREHGYDSVFFYGGFGFFDNMNNFFSGNGYRIIDRADFSSEEKTFTNAWGVADEDLFNKSLTEADKDYKKQQPFFFHIMTVSNHRPYTYPDHKIDIPSHSGRAGAVKYTDYAVNRFLEQAKAKPWFDQTLFVIVADHCASSAGKIGLNINNYHIPLILYCPALLKAGENDKLCSQIDIAPTVFSLLKFKYTKYFFGTDILSKQFPQRAFISNYQKVGYLKDNTFCVLSPKQVVEFYSFKDTKMTILQTQNIKILKECMAYYQGADYTLEHKIHRKTH